MTSGGAPCTVAAREASLTDTTAQPPTLVLRRLAAVVLTAGLAVVAVAAVVEGRFALPAYDDYMRASRLGRGDHDLGWWRYVFAFTYLHWQGRWASCGIESAVLPVVDPTRYYPALIAAVALLNALATYAACRALTRRGPRRLAVAMTAGLLALLWAGMPSLAEAVYWFVGAVENTLPLAAAAAVLTALATVARPRPWAVAALCLAAVATTGLHELYGAMFCLALTAGTAAAFANRSPNRTAWLAVTIAAAAGLAVVVLAPGNRERLAAEVSPLGRRPARVLAQTADQLWVNVRPWLFDAKLVAATLWVAVSPALEAARVPWPSAARVPWRWVVPLTWVVAVAAGFVVPTWAFGGDMPVRTLSGNYVALVAGWLLTVYVWTRPLPSPPQTAAPTTADPPSPWQPFRTPAVAAAALLLLGASLLGVGSAFSAAEDVAHRLRPWHAAAERRYALLRRSPDRAVAVPPLPPGPFLLLSGDVVDDPADYRNRGPVAFFALRRLTLAPPAPAR